MVVEWGEPPCWTEGRPKPPPMASDAPSPLHGIRFRRSGEGRLMSRYATAVPSSSTIWPGIASLVTPSIVVVGATPAAPNRAASTP